MPYVIICNGIVFGPFHTLISAARYADKHFSGVRIGKPLPDVMFNNMASILPVLPQVK